MSRIIAAPLLCLAMLVLVGCGKDGTKDGSNIDPKISGEVPKDKEVKPLGAAGKPAKPSVKAD